MGLHFLIMDGPNRRSGSRVNNTHHHPNFNLCRRAGKTNASSWLFLVIFINIRELRRNDSPVCQLYFVILLNLTTLVYANADDPTGCGPLPTSANTWTDKVQTPVSPFPCPISVCFPFQIYCICISEIQSNYFHIFSNFISKNFMYVQLARIRAYFDILHLFPSH